MTDERKEQLKNFVEGLKYGSIGWYCHDGTYAITEGENKNVETLLDLIDRVPSEDEVGFALRYLNAHDCNCEDCTRAKSIIRKALGIEGKE